MLLLLEATASLSAQSALSNWPPHSRERPTPPVVTPGAFVSQRAPNDATVLFDGSSLDGWTSGEDKPAMWRVVDGAFEVVPNTGTLETRAGELSMVSFLRLSTPLLSSRIHDQSAIIDRLRDDDGLPMMDEGLVAPRFSISGRRVGLPLAIESLPADRARE